VAQTPVVLLSIALSFFPAVARSQEPVSNSSPKAAPEKVSAGATKSLSSAPFVVELIQNRFSFEADGTGTRETTARVTMNSEAAVREFGVLVYPFASSFETIEIKYVRVRKPDGTVVETPATDIQELDSAVSREAPMYTDQREKHIAVKSLSVGDVLEVNVHWTIHDPPAPGHFWVDHSFFKAGICKKEVLEIDLPRELKISYRSGSLQPSIHEEGPRRIYAFESSNLKEPETSKIPEWEKNFHGLTPPEIQFSSFTSWAEVGEWFNSMFLTKVKVTPEVQARADELTKGKTTDEEKIRALYDFVATRIRYIGIDLGIGRYSPHGAAEVLSNRYGDCKDKVALLAALLEASGVHSSPVLISLKYRIDPKFPSPSLFDHVITAVPHEKSYTFADATAELAPFGYLIPALRDRSALIGLPNTNSLLTTTPAASSVPSYERFSVEGSIDAKGTLDAKMKIEDRGDLELELRLAFRATPANRWDELVQAIMQRLGYGGTVSDVSAAQPEDTSHPFWMAFSYHRPDYSDWKNHRITLPWPPILLQQLNEDELHSKEPMPLGSEKEIDHNCTIKLPPGYSVEVPENVERVSKYLEFKTAYTVNKNELKGVRRLKTLEPEIPAAQRAEYDTLAKTIEDSQDRYILVKGGELSDARLPSVLTYIRPVTNGSVGWISNLEEAHKADPENTDILVELSRAYCRAKRPADAVALLEKAVSPEQTVPPEISVALGLAYLDLPDVDKALAQFRKGIDDQTAPEALNEVARGLSQSDGHLEDALRYATRAVSKISSETMDITVPDIEPDSFALMPQLAASWDTFGWIKFRLHDPESAERYLAAAWYLMPSAAIGEHLVEVYEAAGKKQKAAAICNMAKSAVFPGGDEELRGKLSAQMARLAPFLKGAPDGNMALSDFRTFSIPFHAKLSKDFTQAKVVISTTNEPQVRVLFRSGDQELSAASEALSAFKYPQPFPDATPTRIVRLAAFSCSRYSKDCTLVLMSVMDSALAPPE
jgi:tetratricopeptide (TPR) repeat protein